MRGKPSANLNPLPVSGTAAAILSLDGARDLWCLGRTGAGYPKHPLYLPGDTKIERWSP